MSNIEKKKFSLAPKKLEQWQARKEWFFNREHTDRYEDYYEGRYKRAEIWQKKVLAKLIKKDERVETLLEYGCGTTRFTRWWNEIGIEATGADISPFMLGQGNKLFGGDLVWADSHHMPFKDNTFDALMSCPDCKRYFPVIYGIPILIPDEYRDDSLEKPLLKKWGVELQEEDGEQPQLKGGAETAE